MNKSWIEKYRPTKLNNIIGQDLVVTLLKKSIKHNVPIPHLLFYGSPGTGKTTTILSYCYEVFGKEYRDYTIELNASNDRGIDIVKERIIGFAKLRIPEGKFKVVILDEADAMTNGAQTALRKVMEDYPNTRFCIICNYPEKIIPAIVSRCMEFRFNSIGDEFIKVHLTRIYQKEFGTNPNDNIINTIIMLSDGDLRKCINMLQNFKYSNNCCDKEVFYQMEGLMDEETLDKFINDSKNIKTKDDMIRLNDEIKRTNYSIKNIIKQILMKDKTKETELKKLLNDEIDNDFVLIGLINELRK